MGKHAPIYIGLSTIHRVRGAMGTGTNLGTGHMGTVGCIWAHLGTYFNRIPVFPPIICFCFIFVLRLIIG